MELTSGEQLEGRILEVHAESFSLAVKKATRSVQRSQIKKLELLRDTRHTSRRGLALGAAMGAGISIAGLAAASGSDYQPPPNVTVTHSRKEAGIGPKIALVGLTAGIVGGIGYLWGRAIESYWVTVEFK